MANRSRQGLHEGFHKGLNTKSHRRWHVAGVGLATLAGILLLATCGPKKPLAPTAGEAPEPPVVFETAEEARIERMHARVFDQLGGYKGPEACYACHQEQYEAVSRSYHVHQGRIKANGQIAFDPAEAADAGMYTRWYPLSNLDRSAEPDKHWQQMDAIFCAQCHPGGGVLKPYGMDVDCLICHQKSGYKGGAGLGTPAGVDRHGKMVTSNGARLVSLMMAGADVAGDMDRLDLSGIAAKAMEDVSLRVGKPNPDNCNFCHWRTNGKRGTRYGTFRGKATDVHYSGRMRCQECHVTEDHNIGKGKILDAIGTPELRGTMRTCADCHGELPHDGPDAADIDAHLSRLACETCHIPTTYPAAERINWLPGMDMEKMMKQYNWMMPIARLMGMATPEKMTLQINEMVDCYKSMKPAGFMPAYAWYNPDILVKRIPGPNADRRDDSARIWPFNVVRTAFFSDGADPEAVAAPDSFVNSHPVPKAFVARAGGKGKRDTTLAEMRAWNDGQYSQAIIREPVMYFQQFHSIAPARRALRCDDCHSENGRLDYAALGYNESEAAALRGPR